ncbi:MAG: biotin synthase BioB [Desulfobacterales bacterium]|nr:biotin synthase BioB [Desulfobacterales bacterium]
MVKFLNRLTENVLNGKQISHRDAVDLSEISKQSQMVYLFSCANQIREAFKGSVIDLCVVLNAKSGGCSENCKFCAQSSHYPTQIKRYPLVEKNDILAKAKNASAVGANRFGIVVSGRDVKNTEELSRICSAIQDISSQAGVEKCASLGTLTRQGARELKKAGLQRYHHNLETAESFFPKICTTHSYQDRVATVKIAKEEGLAVCSGGIFGLGESPMERLELAFALKELDVDSIPLNFLNPIPGTPLENAPPVQPMEILKLIAIFRFIHPTKDIRVCGGRQRNLRSAQALIYLAGANATMIADYLTTPGSDPAEDIQMIKDLMLEPQQRAHSPQPAVG